MNSVNVKIARLADGSIDVNATLHALLTDLAPIVARESEERPLIGKCVDMVWAERADKVSMTMDSIAHYTLDKLKLDPSDIKAVQKKVESYMRSNPERFLIKRGIGGGVFMLVRLPADERARLVERRSSRAPSASRAA